MSKLALFLLAALGVGLAASAWFCFTPQMVEGEVTGFYLLSNPDRTVLVFDGWKEVALNEHYLYPGDEDSLVGKRYRIEYVLGELRSLQVIS